MAGRRLVLPRRGLLVTLVVLCISSVLVMAPRARADVGAVTEVTDFGTNPGDLQMFEYIPHNFHAGAPLVVFMHGCLTQVSNYDDESGWPQIAEGLGWAIVFPQQKVTNNNNLCFNWTRPDDIVRGKGEAASIVQMVEYMKSTHAIDPSRVFATGHSAGGYFTSVMLAAYPDVFRAGAEVSGGPYRCQTTQPVYAAPPGIYVGPAELVTEFSAREECTQAEIDKTPQEWAELLGMAHPNDHIDARPPIMLWHGSADATVKPANFHELVEQWTAFYGVNRTESAIVTHAGASTYTHDVYKDTTGRTLVETVLVDGADHPYPGDGSAGCPGQANLGICASRLIAWWFANT